MKWLIVALNLPTGSIKYYLVNEYLGVSKHDTIEEIKGFNLLRYGLPIMKLLVYLVFDKVVLKAGIV